MNALHRPNPLAPALQPQLQPRQLSRAQYLRDQDLHHQLATRMPFAPPSRLVLAQRAAKYAVDRAFWLTRAEAYRTVGDVSDYLEHADAAGARLAEVERQLKGTP